MPKKEKKVGSEVFLLTFIGEYVQVISNFILNTTSHEGVEESPLILEGYLLDMDDEFLYIGDSANDISRAIKKETVVFIQVINNEDNIFNLMDQINNKAKKDLN